MTPTQKAIAERAGVDRSLVSRVLGGRMGNTSIRPDVEERIRAAAEELGYFPNLAAQAVKTGRFNTVALLLSTDPERSYLPIGIINGMHDVLAEQGIHLTVTRVPDAKLNDVEYVPGILNTLMCDGIIINYTHHLPEHLLELLERHHLPAVWVNTLRDSDVVYPDNLAAARRATERLLKLGHKRIVYLDRSYSESERSVVHFSVRDRLAGYREAMTAAGLEPIEYTSSFSWEDGTETTDDYAWLSADDGPTAVITQWICYVPHLLRKIWTSGRSIPRDISVVSFTGESVATSSLKFVSSMVEPECELGGQAAKMLLNKISAPDLAISPKKLNFNWSEGTTTGSTKENNHETRQN